MNKRNVTLSLALALLAGIAGAQTPTRVRGVVNTLDGNALSVKSAEGKNVEIQLSEKTEIVFTQAIKLADIKQGDFLGVTSTKRDDGSLTAFEVRRFPKPVNPGHRPFDGKSDQTMTNATVSAMVQSAKGREVTVTYEGGSQKIVMPENASISMLVPGERAQLKPGAPVSLTATPAEGGRLTALRIQVSPPQ
ncbi:MAG TPA: DUF5666 domain-containing protein [Burkholderiales bacterium]|nr:DUF5666 domain-containing protein [Burkholderiales bacterium]